MKNYIKYFQYFYLLIAILFIYDAVSKFLNSESYWVSILLAAIAIFMFYFKRKFAKKYEEQTKNQK